MFFSENPKIESNLEGKISPESPVKLFLWSAAGCDIYGEKKLLEVNDSILIRVKSPKDMTTELLGIPSWETLAVDLTEVVRVQLSSWAVRYEPLVEVTDGSLVIMSVLH